MKRLLFAAVILFTVTALCACGQKPMVEEQSVPTWQEQYDLGVRYLSEGNYEEAIIAFTAAIEIDPKQAPAYVGRGDAYIGSGETEDNLEAAQADYEMAIELDETNVETYLSLADVHIRRGDYDKALDILRSGLERAGQSQEISEKIAEIESGTISDSSGNQRRITGYDSDGALAYWHDFTYDIEGRQSSVTAYNTAGAQIGHIDLTYDAMGRPINSYLRFFDTGEIFEVTCTYDVNGNVTSETWQKGTWSYEYNAKGLKVRQAYHYNDGYVVFDLYEIYEYGTDDRMTKSSAFGNDNTLQSYTLYEYDVAGKWDKTSNYNADGTLYGYQINHYDEAGNRIAFEDYDENGTLLLSETYD